MSGRSKTKPHYRLRKTKKGTRHTVNPAGTKFRRMAAAHQLTKRAL
mgnify:CR=1 FL=1